MAISIDLRYNNTCRVFTAEPDWTWAETASYVESNFLNGGLLIPTTKRPADYTLVRSQNGEKWTNYSAEMTLAEATSLHIDKQSGPYQLKLLRADALIVIIQDMETHKMYEFGFSRAVVGKNKAAFLQMVGAAVETQNEKNCIFEQQTAIGCKAKCSAWFKKTKKVNYDLDDHNCVLLSRFMQVGHEDMKHFPIIIIRANMQNQFADGFFRGFVRKGIIACGILTISGFTIECFFPDTFQIIWENICDLFDFS